MFVSLGAQTVPPGLFYVGGRLWSEFLIDESDHEVVYTRSALTQERDFVYAME